MTEEGPQDARRLLVESPAPRLEVARGFAVSGDEQELMRRFEAEPHTEAVDLEGHAGALRVLRWRLDPAVAEVAAPGVRLVRGAGVTTPTGSLLVDSRVTAALLRFQDGGRRLELSIDRGLVALFALTPSDLSLPVFEPRVATGGEPLDGWVAEHVRALKSSGDPVRVAASVGALVRFWSPTPTDDPTLGPPAVVRGARAWARSVDEGTWARLETRSGEQADRLVAALVELVRALERGSTEPLAVLTLAHERDDLESFALTARLAGHGEPLRATLQSFDRAARTHLTALTEHTGSVGDARLRAVAWCEPEAWWGAIAR